MITPRWTPILAADHGFQLCEVLHPKFTLSLPFGVPHGANGCRIQSQVAPWQYKLSNDADELNAGTPVGINQVVVLTNREQIDNCTLGPDPIPTLSVQFFTGDTGSEL